MPSSPLPTIGIVGAGRLGSALARSLHAAGYPLRGISSRPGEHATRLAGALGVPLLAPADLLGQADLVFLAIPDDALADWVAANGASPPGRSGAAIVHCSGATPAAVLEPLARRGWQIGGCHPLAPFASRDGAVPAGITWAIEAAEPARSSLRRLVESLSGAPIDLRPEDKVLYHAAAVLAANFAVTLAARAVDVLGLCGIAPEPALAALLPLLRGNLENLGRVGLPAALTGPLSRGDWGTVERHLAALDERAPDIAALYRAGVAATTPLLGSVASSS
ncbi:MAG TPA: DUF2520 domain-containing protein [Herpetosiphonaceae bacterium]|nr:DUF2520 domain-containing protein [Herpetosiphonaceae bacterium]